LAKPSKDLPKCVKDLPKPIKDLANVRHFWGRK
jgi:hypothetical protein